MAPAQVASVDRADLADRIFSAALLRGTFTLRSGAVSDRYLDKYRITTQPDLLAPVTAALHDQLRALAHDAQVIVAPALGAVPLATALSLASGLPFVIVRGDAKAYGTARAIEGIVTPGAHGVLVEDVVTSGGAAVEAIAAAREAGLHIAATLCVLDRDGGGREALADCAAPLTALLTAADLDDAFARGVGTPVAND